MSSTLQHDLFSPTCCNPCLLKPVAVKQNKLAKCLECKLILYCCTAHQKLDWRIHRKFCQAASAILFRHNCDHLVDINGPILSQEDLNVTTLKVKYTHRSILKRPLVYHEEELTSFPIPSNVRTLLLDKHVQIVPMQTLYVSKGYIRGEMQFIRTEFDQCYGKSPALNLIPIRAQHSEYQKFSFVSDFFCIATVTYIVKHLDMTHYPGQQFTIYVAGATTDEMWFAPTHVEFFFACVPQLLKLNVIFVGPEVPDVGKAITEFKLSDGRLLCRSSHRPKLEEHFFERQHHLPANMIVCFNCGFSDHTQKQGSEGDPWFKGIRYLTEMPEIPLVFTSYTSLEADFDFAAFMKVIRWILIICAWRG